VALELHRMLKPDALLIATYMGRWNSEWLAGEPWVEDRVGFNVLHHTRDWEAPVELSTEELERRFDDPREYAAVRLNLFQVPASSPERGSSSPRLSKSSSAPTSSAIVEYEKSSSWRITRPLRQGAQLLRRGRDRL
jgi:hypothetical protein